MTSHWFYIQKASSTHYKNIRKQIEIQKLSHCLDKRKESRNLSVMWKMLSESTRTTEAHIGAHDKPLVQ